MDAVARQRNDSAPGFIRRDRAASYHTSRESTQTSVMHTLDATSSAPYHASMGSGGTFRQ